MAARKELSGLNVIGPLTKDDNEVWHAGNLATGADLRDFGRLIIGLSDGSTFTPLTAQGTKAVLKSLTGNFFLDVQKFAGSDESSINFREQTTNLVSIGALGNNDFTLQVHPDDGDAINAMIVDRATGNVSFSQEVAVNILEVGPDAALWRLEGNFFTISDIATFQYQTDNMSLRLFKRASDQTSEITFESEDAAFARIGTFESDDFRIRVSDGGGDAIDAVVVNHINGHVLLPNRTTINDMLVLHKESPSETIALSYESETGIHAQVGLMGDDNLTFKVSPDGSTFHDAMLIANNSGSAVFSKPTFISDLYVGFYAAADYDPVFLFKGPFANFKSKPGGSIQIGIEKSDTDNSAHITFRDRTVDYADIGLLENDDFTIRVRPDADTEYNAVIVRKRGDTEIGGSLTVGGNVGNHQFTAFGPTATFINTADSVDVKIQKNRANNNAGLSFNYISDTHARMGLLANNDLTLKVSSDGTNFLDAVIVDKDDGTVAFPQMGRIEAVYREESTTDTTDLNNVNGSGQTLEVLSHGFGRSRKTADQAFSTGTDTGGTDGVMGERDFHMACTTAVTYAEAVALVESIGARLPTAFELHDGAGWGMGCGLDNLTVWTQTPGSSSGTRKVNTGKPPVASRDTDLAETSTAGVTYVFDKQHPGSRTVTPEGFTASPTANFLSSKIDATAKGYGQIINSRLVTNGGAEGGNLAKTTQVVLAASAASDNRTVLGSADDGNVVEIFASGHDYEAGTVLERHFMSKGEIVTAGETIPAGAVITSTKGVNGASDLKDARNPDSNRFGHMPFGIEGFAGRHFFLYAFRQSDGTSIEEVGKVYVAAGAIAANVFLKNGAGTDTIEFKYIPPYGLAEFRTNANSEFQLEASCDVFVGVASNASDFIPGYDDLRLVPPLATDIIGHTGNGYISALYANTSVKYYKQDGTTGTLTVSPGSPQEMNAIGGDNGYIPAGFVRLIGSGPISAFSGADGAGFEATPFFPVSSLAQRVPLPYASRATGDTHENSITIASPFKGTAIVHNQNGTEYATIPLNRVNAVTTSDDQLHPCVGQLAPSGSAGATVSMSGNFNGGYVEADVPIFVVQNSNDEEIVWPGITPDEIRAEIRRDASNLLRKRVIGGTGNETWELV